jgi:histidinol dehydrogenase
MQLTVEKLSQLSPERRRSILGRSLVDVSEVFARVRGILDDLKARGDQCSVEEHAGLKDGLTAADFRVRPEETAEAYAQVPAEVVEHLKKAAANIRTFHRAQLERPQ